MPTIYSPGQISAGTLNVAPINIGTQKSLEILNYSSYFLCLATTQAGATDKNDHSLVTVIEPWQGIRMPVPIGTANTQLYVGVDPTLSTNPVTFGNVVDLPGVQYQTFNVVVAPSRWALLGQSVVNPDGATVGTLVNNDSGSPVLNNPLQASASSQSANVIQSGQGINVTIGQVIQAISFLVENSGTTTYGTTSLSLTLNDPTNITIYYLAFSFDGLAPGKTQFGTNLILGSGIAVANLEWAWNDSASNDLNLGYNIITI